MKNRFVLVLIVFIVQLFYSQFTVPLYAEDSQSRSTVQEKTGFETYTAEKLKKITALTVNLFAMAHLDGGTFTDEKYAKSLKKYIETLDPFKYYFTKGEVEKFLSVQEGDAERVTRGDIYLPFEIFNLYKERHNQFAAFAHRLFSENTEKLLNTDEDFMFNRKDVPYEQDMSAIYALWRKRLINELVSVVLNDRITANRLEELKKKKMRGEKIKDSDIPKPETLSAEKRVLKKIDAIKRIQNDFEPIDVLEIYLNAIASVYDPHSAYLAPDTDEDNDMRMSMKLIGIGATLSFDDGYTKIVDLVPGGPAAKDGRLQVGDLIVAVAQEGQEPVDVVNMKLRKVVRLIRGPEGTKVTLYVVRNQNSSHGPEIKITITRAVVMLKDGEAKGEILEVTDSSGKQRKIGVIDLPSFYEDFEAKKHGEKEHKCASEDVKKILLEFNRKKVDGIIMDLRANGGGSLFDCLKLTGLFIESGPVVQIKGKDGNPDVMNDDDNDTYIYDGPLLVMVNRLSASASEIFAAAIQDYGRGIIVGDQKTFGKGTVQTAMSLDPFYKRFFAKNIAAGTLHVSTAKFYRINGQSTQLKGVIPDIIYPSFLDLSDYGEDKEDYAMKWDTIEPAEYTVTYKGWNLQTALSQIRKASEKRIAASKKFSWLRKGMKKYELQKEKKSLSLNLEKRWGEYHEEQKLEEEYQNLIKNQTTRQKITNETNQQKKDNDDDFFLDESLNVLLDLIMILEKE